MISFDDGGLRGSSDILPDAHDLSPRKFWRWPDGLNGGGTRVQPRSRRGQNDFTRCRGGLHERGTFTLERVAFRGLKKFVARVVAIIHGGTHAPPGKFELN